jgi:hypothetical protein
VIEEEEKTLMMIVGQEGRAPKWWYRAWASKIDRSCSRCREGRRKEGRGRKGRAGEGEGKGEGAGLDSVGAGKSLARFGRVEKRREEEIDASKGG